MSDELTVEHALVEAALEIAFGDGELDPGATIEGLRRSPAAQQAVRVHLETLRAVALAKGQADGEGISRLDNLLTEATSHEAVPESAVPMPSASRESSGIASVPSNVVTLGAPRPGSSAQARASRRWSGPRWLAPALGFALAAGLALFLWNRRQDPGPGPGGQVGEDRPALADVRDDLTTAQVQALAAQGEPDAMGFAGAAVGSATRGYLLAAARDLHASAARDGGDVARSMALGYADRAVLDLDPQVATVRALSEGCAALFGEKKVRAVCEHGTFVYRMKRDIGSVAGERRARQPEAVAFVTWARSLALPELAPHLSTLGERVTLAAPLDVAERRAWDVVLGAVRAILEAEAG